MFADRRIAMKILLGAFGSAPAVAQASWPSRGVKFITPSQPGGSPDVIARAYGEALATRWGQSVIVKNRPGADGAIAVTGLREASAGDQPALLVAPTSIVTVPQVLRRQPPFGLADLMPVSMAASDFLAVAVPETSPARSLDELVGMARAEPGRLNCFAVSGGPAMVFSHWMQSREVPMTAISYRGAPDALRDLTENRIQAVMTPLAPLLPVVAAGKVRLLAVTNPDRSPKVPEIMTAAEAGHPELLLEGAIAFFAARGLKPEEVRRIAADIAAVAAESLLVQRLGHLGVLAKTGTPDGLEAMMDEQVNRWRRIAGALAIQPT